MSRLRTIATAAAALATVAALSACSSDDNSSGGDSPAPADAIPVLAQSPMKFDKESYEGTAGEVAFELTNEDVLEHSLLIEGVDDLRIVVATNGDTASGSTTLEAGEYTIYCDIVGHRENGMEATLTVS